MKKSVQTKTESKARDITARHRIFALLFLLIALCGGCQKRETRTNEPASSASGSPSSPSPQASPVQVRYFKGSGIVTKIVRENPYDKSLASVELNHGEIVGLMPAMRMEFYVKSVTLLDGLKVDDVIDFTIEEKGGTEIISEIKKK